MRDLSEYPTPVALPLARLLAADNAARRLGYAADTGYAVLKYVALVRMADWLRVRLESRTDDRQLIENLQYGLWGAAATHWWQLTLRTAQVHPQPLAPATPQLDALPQSFIEDLNRARQFRHSSQAPPDDAGQAAQTEHVALVLLEACEPILRLPFLRVQGLLRERIMGPTTPPMESGDWQLAVEVRGTVLLLDAFFLLQAATEQDDRHDVYIYERLSQRGMIVEHDRYQIELAQRGKHLELLLQWLRQRRIEDERAATRLIEQIRPDEFESRLRKVADDDVSHEWRASASAPVAPRPEVEAALALLPPAGVRALAFVGPSGIGKTHELMRWLLRSPRLPVWIRAAGWQGQDLATMIGTNIQGQTARIPLPLLKQRAEQVGLAIAVDGLNETASPAELLQSIYQGLEALPGVAAHVVVTSRTEQMTKLPRIADFWITGPGLQDGAFELCPLSRESAGRLWEQVRKGRMRPYEQLSIAWQRLLQTPLLAMITHEVLETARQQTLDPDALLSTYVSMQTTDLERVLLRHIAGLMYQRRQQTLDEQDLDRELAAASRQLGPYGSSFERLVSRGLIVVSEADSDTRSRRIRFAHDRLLQWAVGHWLAARAQGTAAGSLKLEGRWGKSVEERLHSPALASGIGYALALNFSLDETVLKDLLLSTNAHEVTAGRLGAIALAESEPEAALRLLEAAWPEVRRRPHARDELLALAAELGATTLLAGALKKTEQTEAAVWALMRVRRQSPEIIHATLSTAWQRIAGWPWLHLRTVKDIAYTLYLVQFTEGARRIPYQPFFELSNALITGLLGSGKSWLGKVLRRTVLSAFVPLTALAVGKAPPGPVDVPWEYRNFCRLPVDQRAVYLPFVAVFAGQQPPQAIEELARRAIRSSEMVPCSLLERALIRASQRQQTAESALDLAYRLGKEAQDIRPVGMAAQASLYILSKYLERFPTAADWNQRFAQFEDLLRGWLAAATDHRWTAASGRRYKSLHAAAHSGLCYGRFGTRSPITGSLWQQALAGNEQLALDLLDDMFILAMSRQGYAIALKEMEPFLNGKTLSENVMKMACDLLAAIGEREPELLSEALKGPGPNRVRLAERVPLVRSKLATKYTVYLDFDDDLVLNPDFTVEVSLILEQLLKAPSFSDFLRFTLSHAVNRVSGRQLFPEVNA